MMYFALGNNSIENATNRDETIRKTGRFHEKKRLRFCMETSPLLDLHWGGKKVNEIISFSKIQAQPSLLTIFSERSPSLKTP